MIVTIDGPAGAGKSSVARGLAQRLGFDFLDTGAMYRCVALAGHRAQLDWEQPDQLVSLVRQLQMEWRGERIWLDGSDVSQEIRSPEITALVVYAAGNPDIRAHLVELQRAVALGTSLVTEGRDQGTVVFPHAECKFYLTASPEERARRRYLELQSRGDSTSYESVLEQQNLRDEQDAQRDIGALRRATDAVEVCSDGLTPDQVIDRLETIARARQYAQ